MAIAENIEDPWRTGLESVPTVSLLLRAPASALLGEGVVQSLEVRHITGREAQHLEELAEPATSALLLVVEAVLDDASAAGLEDRGIGYVDAAGRAWVPGAPRSAYARPTRRRARTSSIRAAQLIADHPDTTWTEPKLAKQAQVSSGTAHNLVRDLLSFNLVERTGEGRAGVHSRDTRGLRRWLVSQARREQPHMVSCYIPDAEDLAAEVDGVPLIRSGAEGARLLGVPVVSSIQRVLIRVPVSSGLEDLPARLGGLRTAAGANVVLVEDPERFAANDARLVHSVWVAPPSRIATDLTLEPRGDAASSVFLDLWGEGVL
ncbi:MAG TPA: hypothetical protein PLS29_03410 [Acidimicrobiales bacterium]|nr:hypothetical protein [Acidimicrobiales bacterium]